MRRAKEHEITIYEMVRDPKLHPLEKYLDAADMALVRDKANLENLTKQMSDEDEGMRWWAIVGLRLLEEDAARSIAAALNHRVEGRAVRKDVLVVPCPKRHRPESREKSTRTVLASTSYGRNIFSTISRIDL